MNHIQQRSSPELACQVLVIGAGPAGAFLAGLLAARGVDVILVERSSFPRTKVCGCCLSLGGLAILSEANVPQPNTNAGPAKYFDRLVCKTGATDFELALPRGRCLSRERFDASLVRWGTDHGVRFMPETRARAKEITTDTVQVELVGDHKVSCNARILVCADGLGSTSLAEFPQFAFHVSKNSRVGIGAIFDKDCGSFDDSAIYMHYHPQGYLGAVRLEDDRVNFAASIDVRFLREEGPEQACRRIMNYAGGPETCFSSVRWSGTPALTRYRDRVADWRIFVIGDAAGYVEPFTGEGMTSALASAQLLAPLIVEAVREWQCDSALAWQLLHRKFIQRNQTISRLTTEILHKPRLVNLSASFLAACPGVGTSIINRAYSTARGVANGC